MPESGLNKDFLIHHYTYYTSYTYLYTYQLFNGSGTPISSTYKKNKVCIQKLGVRCKDCLQTAYLSHFFLTPKIFTGVRFSKRCKELEVERWMFKVRLKT
nr:MAG TPA: hypothetical protein [Caudoviricetes sp.]